ncbi:MAG: sensor histidine kinase [Nonlabens sp.]
MKYFYTLFITCCAFPFLRAQNSSQADSVLLELKKFDVNQQIITLDSLINNKIYDYDVETRLAQHQFQITKAEEKFEYAVYALNRLIKNHTLTFGDPTTSIELYEANKELLDKVTEKDILAETYNNIGRSFLYAGRPQESIDFFDMGIDKGTGDQIVYADLFNNKSIAQGEIGDIARASFNAQKAIKIYKKENDTLGEVFALANLASFYSRAGFYDKFHESNDEAIALAQKLKNYRNLLGLYYNQATTYDKMDKPNLRIKALENSLDAAQKFEGRDFIEPRILTTYIGALLRVGQIEKAEQFLDTLDSRPPSYKQPPFDNMVEYIDGMYAFAKADYPKAAKIIEKQSEIFEQMQDYDNVLYTLDYLADIYEKSGETAKELDARKRYYKLNDSILKKQNRTALTYYQTLYETEKRDRIIDERGKEIDQLDAEIKLQQLYYLIGLLILLLIAGGIFYWRYRKNQREKQQLQRNFTQDIINSVEMERKRISHELHDGIGNSLLLIRNRLTTDKDNSVLLQETIDEVREMSHRMHPYNFEKQGIIQSLDSLVADLQDSSQVFYSFETDLEKVDMPAEKNIQIYRIMQEAINNVEKHAQATACQISAEQSGGAYIFTVKDNGKGLPSLNKVNRGLGLRSMEERAQNIGASIKIEGKENEGTVIKLIV